MDQFDDRDGTRPLEKLRAAMLMLCFGLGTLAFLVAIDRPDWFALRPATGTATAMAVAGEVPPAADTGKN